MQTIEKLLTYPEATDTEVEELLQKASDIVIGNLDVFTEKFQHSNSENGFYEAVPNISWTTGFWTGEIWLAYEKTRDERLKEAGEVQVRSFLDRIIDKVEVAHHDMGFLYSPSCVAAYKLTGNEDAKRAAVLAAENLITRFQEKGQFIQAWGELGAEDNYRLIIDCLINVPLLYWATEVTGDAKFRDIGERHVKTAMKYVIRPDHSTYHTFFFDPKTGLPKKGVTHQGYRDGSAWGRGQAWGIYGAALSYAGLKQPEYLEIFEQLTDFFLTHLPQNLVPYWDFDFDDGSDEPRYSSCAAVVACGMLEMAKYLSEEKAQYYRGMAKRLIKALSDQCLVRNREESNGILLHGTYCKSSPYNTCPNWGVDECVSWGDYYYMEALTRLHKEWNSYWL